MRITIKWPVSVSVTLTRLSSHILTQPKAIPLRSVRAFMAPFRDKKDSPRLETGADSMTASESRPHRRSLSHIGIPNRCDTLSVHVRCLREQFYLLHRAKHSYIESSVCTVTNTLENHDPPSSKNHTEQTEFVAVNNLETELLCVGGQFE